MRTDVDAVPLTSTANVVHFRDEIKVRCDAILQGYVSSQLAVYRNLSAFLNRENPLSSSSLINVNAGSSDDPLVVVLPPSISQDGIIFILQ